MATKLAGMRVTVMMCSVLMTLWDPGQQSMLGLWQHGLVESGEGYADEIRILVTHKALVLFLRPHVHNPSALWLGP